MCVYQYCANILKRIQNAAKDIAYRCKCRRHKKEANRRTLSTITDKISPDNIILNTDPLKQGSTIRIGCKLKPKCRGFNIELNTCDNKTALRVSILIYKNLIGRNFKLNYWGSEETDSLLPFCLKKDKYIQIEIFIIKEAFLIALNGFHIAKYKHHLPYTNINQISISGLFENVRFIQDVTTEYPIRPYETLHMGHLIMNTKKLINNNKIKTKREKFLYKISQKRKDYEIAEIVTKNKKRKSLFMSFNKLDEPTTAKKAEQQESTEQSTIDNNEMTVITSKQSKNVMEEEMQQIHDDYNDVFDKELFYHLAKRTIKLNESYIPLPFYGTFEKGLFKMHYTLVVKGRIHLKPQQLEINLQTGIQIWPPSVKILTIRILFISEKLLKNKSNNYNNTLNTNIYIDDSTEDKYITELERDVMQTLQPNSVFHIEIIRRSSYFEILINKNLVKSIAFTNNPKLAEAVFINGDFKLYNVEIMNDS